MPRYRLRPVGAALVALAAVLGVTQPASAGQPGVAITSIGGQQVQGGRVAAPVGGIAEVTGSAALGEPSAPRPAPLVADAGDSPFVISGRRAVLLGAGHGGQQPYRFAWTTQHGRLDGADASSAELDTTGLAAGRYPVQLTITDSAGATATDTVTVVVATSERLTLLDLETEDTTPGVTAVPSWVDLPFTVPDAVDAMTVELSFGVPANDYDLRVLDPSGAVVASSGNAAGEPESTGVSTPRPGQWTLRADRFLTVPDTLYAVVTATRNSPDPRPTVTAGGPYTFRTGTAQTLDGTVAGGAAPVSTGWDLNADGVFETAGTDVAANLPDGRHLITLKATDATGLERRQSTTVLVGSAERIAAESTAITVIGVADTGINPYHLEFSAQTYPDPGVLARTANFTAHPSSYLPGYPADAPALNITHGQGYFPPGDARLWDGNTTIQPGRMYWIPGTKIVGAVDAGGSTGATSGDDPHPILDDNGHGSGSASVSAGNRYGYCPTCLLVVVEGLDETVVAGLPWVDISTNSFGYIGGAPLGPIGDPTATKQAAERGQTTLFAAGNGVGNAFDVPVSTYGSDQTGPDWNITVGALRRDNQRAVVGDGIPVHISAWGDGNLPSACRSGTVGQCAFGGTSAATPYTAGVFGTVLTRVRETVGDGAAGQRPHQVVARGLPLDGSTYLADGALTRGELRDAVLRTAFPLNTENRPSPFPYPLTAPYSAYTNVLFEGYGAATPEGANRATDVLLGRELMPDRSYEDEFFTLDRQVRDSLYGGFDRDGDGDTDSHAPGTQLPVSPAGVSTVAGTLAALNAAAARLNAPQTPTGQNTTTYFLHRRLAGAPGTEPTDCTATNNEQYMSRVDATDDLEPCFDSRVTSVVAAFRPVGIFAADDTLDAPLPAGSTVYATLYLAGETPGVIRPTGVLVATDREVGSGAGVPQAVAGSGPGGAACATLGEACWTKFDLSFTTTRPVFRGEQLTFQVQLLGARSWAFGHQGGHASKIAIVAADLPPGGLEPGVTVDSPAAGSTVPEREPVMAGGRVAFPDAGPDPVGGRPVQREVQVSLDDASFAAPRVATIDGTDSASGTWHVDLGRLPRGQHTVYARTRTDNTYSAAASTTFTIAPDAQVQWQVVPRNAVPDPAAWRPADGLQSWRFTFDTDHYANGPHRVVVRLVDRGAETARSSVAVRLR